MLLPDDGLNVIIPTTGRPTLAATLRSLKDLDGRDRVIVVADGNAPGVGKRLRRPGKAALDYISLPHNTGDWGATPRHVGMELARGGWLWFLDDDDTATPDAVGVIRRALTVGKRIPRMFKMKRGEPYNDTLWTIKEYREGNVSSQMMILPAVQSLCGRWGRYYSGDWGFLEETAGLWCGEAVWRQEVICVWNGATAGVTSHAG
jgi:glycosyltransferase involved in cell wall biosynthesis